jgi:enoyl-CoA hydratase/carnithine racemase
MTPSQSLATYSTTKLCRVGARKSIENKAYHNEAPVHHSAPHADLLATYRRAEAEAAHKFGLIQAAAKKGPVAIQKATETATKAAKRRDSYAKKLTALGVDLTD